MWRFPCACVFELSLEVFCNIDSISNIYIRRSSCVLHNLMEKYVSGVHVFLDLSHIVIIGSMLHA